MNRYKSSQKWRKVRAGVYESPHNGEGQYLAMKQEGCWVLRYCWGQDALFSSCELGEYLTLADCQEIADNREDHGG